MSGERLDVSFLVPTLNRGNYVLRAVQSCLDAIEHAGRTGEVVVLDSQSDDGSWEALQARFGGNASVRLRQNKRGLGPLCSWLDAAEDLSGATVTYVWSDDYIAPAFLETLAPSLASSGTLAMGDGTIRDADCADALPRTGGRVDRSRADLLLAFLGVRAPDDAPLAVSPTCALFSRATFEHWRARVGDLSQASEIRRQFMWRRAIGPDLLLYLVALADERSPTTPMFGQSVAQFSSHAGSITVSSPVWNLTLGYWLGRVAFLTDRELAATLPADARAAAYGQALLQGLLLRRKVPAEVAGFSDRSAAIAELRAEIAGLGRAARRNAGTLAMVSGSLGAVARRLLGVVAARRGGAAA